MKDLKDLGDLSARRYGMISYDIPDDLSDLSASIRTSIRKVAFMVHKSGYVLPYENRAAVEELVKEAHLLANEKRREKGQPEIPVTIVRIMPIDPAGNAEIMDWVNEAAIQFAKDITASLEERLSKIAMAVEKAVNEEKIPASDMPKEKYRRRRAVVTDLKKRLEDADAALFWFATTNNVKSAMKATKELIAAQEEILRRERQELREKNLLTR